VHASDPDLIVAARRSSPLVAGRADGTGFVASDIPALLAATREVYVVDEDQVVEVRPGTLRITTLAGDEVTPVRRRVEGDVETVEKGGYPDFMLKEIHEQPQAVRETLRDRTLDGQLMLERQHPQEGGVARRADRIWLQRGGVREIRDRVVVEERGAVCQERHCTQSGARDQQDEKDPVSAAERDQPRDRVVSQTPSVGHASCWGAVARRVGRPAMT
ncbi:MAG: hypothetical protein ABR525_11295, partial [Candidatus Limnocylindria bacterium]